MHRITPLEAVKEDERGRVFACSTRPAGNWLVITRKKGTVSGQHYHEGRVAGKNPEVLILLAGEIELYVKDLRTAEEERTIIRNPAIIEIFPFVWHEVTALTDALFLELNSLDQHNRDTVRTRPADRAPE